MKDAISQIQEYIAGNRNARIACDDEGELYRLFHEVNSLVTILNATLRTKPRKPYEGYDLRHIHQLKPVSRNSTIYNG